MSRRIRNFGQHDGAAEVAAAVTNSLRRACAPAGRGSGLRVLRAALMRVWALLRALETCLCALGPCSGAGCAFTGFLARFLLPPRRSRFLPPCDFLQVSSLICRARSPVLIRHVYTHNNFDSCLGLVRNGYQSLRDVRQWFHFLALEQRAQPFPSCIPCVPHQSREVDTCRCCQRQPCRRTSDEFNEFGQCRRSRRPVSRFGPSTSKC